ncbi:MAG: C4-dicarboxylate-specific signal transduction histidine kinase [Candidatus Krumholzibacteriia bacterium]|jgi:C4-dicarboxylate-specific signal transduction histidine kinase
MMFALQENDFIEPALAEAMAGKHHRRLLHGYLHKTSNTLCGIKGYASLIAGGNSEAPETETWANKIITEIEKMEKIFRSVGDLTQPKQNPDLGVDLPRLLDHVFNACQDKCANLEILSGRLPEGELLLPKADLLLVLTELLCNASEGQNGPNQPVRVEVTAAVQLNGRLTLRLKDNGLGMSPELAVQATTPFLTTKDNHLGVGLTRVETLLDMYGLAWALRSTPGAGTVVTLEVAESAWNLD